ncbi:MAG TPA: hypothetical protein VNO25_13095 [Streptosporangiaceae bacterium]|nr:hypothetical protein [Streptosporangiaceae bacterium]
MLVPIGSAHDSTISSAIEDLEKGSDPPPQAAKQTPPPQAAKQALRADGGLPP